MRIFNNKLSRINFLILMVILPYLYIDMSNTRDAAGIRDAALSVVNILDLGLLFQKMVIF